MPPTPRPPPAPCSLPTHPPYPPPATFPSPTREGRTEGPASRQTPPKRRKGLTRGRPLPCPSACLPVCLPLSRPPLQLCNPLVCRLPYLPFSRHTASPSTWLADHLRNPACLGSLPAPPPPPQSLADISPVRPAGGGESESRRLAVLFGSSSDPRTHPPPVLLVSREPRLPARSAQCAELGAGCGDGQGRDGVRGGGGRVAIPAAGRRRPPPRQIAYPPWRPSAPPGLPCGRQAVGPPGVTIESPSAPHAPPLPAPQCARTANAPASWTTSHPHRRSTALTTYCAQPKTLFSSIRVQ